MADPLEAKRVRIGGPGADPALRGSPEIPRMPPQNQEAEQSVLGGILIDNNALDEVLDILKVDDFYHQIHQNIFQSMIELRETSKPIDYLTLTEKLKNKEQLKEVGGAAYISSLADGIPTAANIGYYAKIVREKSLLRQLITSCSDIIGQAYEGPFDTEEFLERAEKRIFDISQNRLSPSMFPIRDIVKKSFANIERILDNRELLSGIPTGFTDLDQLTQGFQPGDLIIIAGRPSMGKTSFSLNIAQYAAIHHRIPVAIFSLEMAKEQLGIRMLCSEARVKSTNLKRGYMADEDLPRLVTAASILSEAPIVVDDSPLLSALEIRAKARRLKAKKEVGMIIIDYLQQMQSWHKSDSRQQEISEISRSLKALSKELSIPVVALSQLSRKPEDRKDKRPLLADLRESGAIEQDADLVIFIYRKEVYEPGIEDEDHTAEIIVSKHRNGPTGIIKLNFIKEYTRFENMAYPGYHY